jgi:hypothetical protein
MKTVLSVLCVATLTTAAAMAAPTATAPQATASTAAASQAISPAVAAPRTAAAPAAPPADTTADLCGAASSGSSGLPGLFAGVGIPRMEPLVECVPTCPYYYTYCTELCSGLGGVKSFICTPAPPGECAMWTCTCNKSL